MKRTYVGVLISGSSVPSILERSSMLLGDIELTILLFIACF